MIVFWGVLRILLWLLGALTTYLLGCFVVGFVLELIKSVGIRRRPKFRVVRPDEEW